MLNTPIAIVGMDCFLPGAASAIQLWDNIKRKQNGVLRLASAEKAGMHVSVGYLENADRFDFERFGLSKREASQIDPQHRMFINCTSNALEFVQKCDFTSENFGQSVGVFASCPMNTYLPYTKTNIDTSLHTIEGLQSTLQNDKDYLALRTAHLLNLRGPAVNVQASCSSSVVGAHLACLALGAGDCDLAVVGGASVMCPQFRPYRFVEGSIFSADGKCRPFTKEAKGTVHGNGAAVVVLKRLENAVEDKNPIYSVIISSAINNDGNRKDGFTAPSAEGQCDVMERALEGIDVDSIGFIETHGTGTKLGDRIEVEGLTKTFSAKSTKRNFCALGTIKANIGHLEAASSAASLIKTAMCLSQRGIPSDIYDSEPIDLVNSPFYFPESYQDWKADDGKKRRASISSFGMGGTNAHMVLEEPPNELLGVVEHLSGSKSNLEEQPSCWIRPRPDLSNQELGVTVSREADEAAFEVSINIHSYKWFQDHLIGGKAVVPGTYYIYLMNGAIKELEDDKSWKLRSIEIKNTLNLTENKTNIRIIRRKTANGWSVQVESRVPDSWDPVVHATAEAVPVEAIEVKNVPHLSELLKGEQEPLYVEDVYKNQKKEGMFHGPLTQNIRHAVKTPQGVLGVIADFENHLHKDVDRQVCLLDSCLQLFRFAHGENHAKGVNAYMLTSIKTLDFSNLSLRPGQGIWCLANNQPSSHDNSFLTDFLLFSEDGDVVGRIKAAQERKISFKSEDKISPKEQPIKEEPKKEESYTRETMINLLKEIIADNLGSDITEIQQTDTLETLGMDSFTILELSMALQDKLNQTIDPNDVERDSTVEEIAERLLKIVMYEEV